MRHHIEYLITVALNSLINQIRGFYSLPLTGDNAMLDIKDVCERLFDSSVLDLNNVPQMEVSCSV